MTKNDISALLFEARTSITDYCISVCKAQCCKRGMLALDSQEQANVVLQGKLSAAHKTEKHGKTYYEYDLNKTCPSFDGKQGCTIYKNKHRPKACHEFPLLQLGTFIVPIEWCPAVQDALFTSYFEKFEQLGYKILRNPNEKQKELEQKPHIDPKTSVVERVQT